MIAWAEKRSDWSLAGQVIQEFSFWMVLFGHRNSKHREMVALYLLLDRDLFDESDWLSRVELN